LTKAQKQLHITAVIYDNATRQLFRVQLFFNLHPVSETNKGKKFSVI